MMLRGGIDTTGKTSWEDSVPHPGGQLTCDDPVIYEHQFAITLMNYRKWSESHPYGSTFASEPMNDWDDETYELNGYPITVGKFEEMYGKDFAQRKIQAAIDKAMENADDAEI